MKQESTEDPVAADGSRTGTDEGPIGEVLRTVTWAELGVAGPADLAPQQWAYVADGGDWVEVPTPEPSGPLLDEYMRLDATDDALLLTVNEVSRDHSSRSVSYRSRDGQSWEPLDVPGDGQLLTVGNTLVALGSSPERIDTLQVSQDGGTWSPLDLGSLDPTLADLPPDGWIQGSSGPLGIALVASDQEGEVRTLLFSTDLEHWSITDLNQVVPEGTSVGEVIVGTDRIVVLGNSNKGEKGSPERSATMTGVPRAG